MFILYISSQLLVWVGGLVGWSDKTKVMLNSTQVEVEVWVLLSWAWQLLHLLRLVSISTVALLLSYYRLFATKLHSSTTISMPGFANKIAVMHWCWDWNSTHLLTCWKHFYIASTGSHTWCNGRSISIFSQDYIHHMNMFKPIFREV